MTGTLESIDLRGLRFTPGSVDQLVELTRATWSAGGKETLFFQNVHMMHLQLKDQRLVEAFAGTVAMIDGYPLLNLLRFAGHAVEDDQRATAVDLIDPMLAAVVKEHRRCFVIGQPEHVLGAALNELRARHPNLVVDGHHGFFDTGSAEADHVIAAANEFGADLVLVGMGSPKTEHWVSAERERFSASVVWSCGALMEYIGGSVATPPRWAGPMRVEWAFRLMSDPRRFLFRYLVEPIIVAVRLAIRSKRTP